MRPGPFCFDPPARAGRSPRFLPLLLVFPFLGACAAEPRHSAVPVPASIHVEAARLALDTPVVIAVTAAEGAVRVGEQLA